MRASQVNVIDSGMSAEIRGAMSALGLARSLQGEKPWLGELIAKVESGTQALQRLQEEMRSQSASVTESGPC